MGLASMRGIKGMGKLTKKSDKPIQDLDDESRFRAVHAKSDYIQDLGCLVVIVCRDRADRDETLSELGCDTEGYPTEFISSVEVRKSIREEVKELQSSGMLEDWIGHEIKH